MFAFLAICFIANNIYTQIPPLRAKFIAEHDNDGLGYNGLTSGDINGDGVNDLILGASGYDNFGLTNTGRFYIFYGRNFSGNINVQTADIIIDGVTDFGAFSGAGILSCDVDGDGLYDVMTNAAEIDCVVYDPRGNMPFTLCNFYIFLGKTLITKNYFTTDEADAVISGFLIQRTGGIPFSVLEGIRSRVISIMTGMMILCLPPITVRNGVKLS